MGAYALSEAGSGSDAFALACRAEDKGDHYELTGRKLWITNGGEAELFIVMANLDPSKGYKGITSFLVERTFPGFTVGKKEDKLGIRASSTCELVLEGCRVPKENVLGEVGKGYKIAIETLERRPHRHRRADGGRGPGRLRARGSGTRRSGSSSAGPSPSSRPSSSSSPSWPPRSRPRACSPTTRRACATPGLPFVKEAAMAKLFASRAAEHVTSKAIEVYGGYGFTREYPVEKYFRDQKVGQIYEGTTNMQLLVIAKQLLGRCSCGRSARGPRDRPAGPRSAAGPP